MLPDQPQIAATTLARNATLDDLTAMLREQDARKLDIVAPAWAIRAHNGQLVVEGTEPVSGPDGVTLTSGTYVPTEVCDLGLAGGLGIPAAYLRRTRTQRPALYDSNVNSWLEGDQRKFLIRCLRPASGEGPGAARAFLPDGCKVIDNLDVLLAALEGIRQAGVPVEVDGCDLTGRRMYVRVVCDLVQALAPALLRGCRSPLTGAAGADYPVVFAGFVFSNSETGCGGFTVTPRLVVQACRTGMTITRAVRSVHHGGRPGEGAVAEPGSTPADTLELITASTADAVAAFLRPAYVDRVVRAISARADHPLTDPQEAVAIMSHRLRFTEAQQAAVTAQLINGSDATAGGVMHAVTSTARTLPDADAAQDLESQGLRALEIAASL